MNKLKVIFFLTLILLINNKFIKAKVFNQETYICADEIGPILEFVIPNFKENLEEKKFKFKVYESQNRNLFNLKEGIIKKQSSPIDDSYYYYKAHSNIQNDKEKLINFEFFPPTHLLFKQQNAQYIDLVCWVDEKNRKNNLPND